MGRALRRLRDIHRKLASVTEAEVLAALSETRTSGADSSITIPQPETVTA